MEVDRIQSLTGHLRAVAGAALDFLLPATCVSCERLLDNRERGLVCGRCWARLAPLPAPQCVRCGHPRVTARCRWCELLPPCVRAVRSVCWTHTGTGSAIVHALKYGGWHAVANDIAERMSRLAWPTERPADRWGLVPVPLSPSRARERGFNQSERLAASLAERWKVPLWRDVLERTRSTATQTRLTADARLENVWGAFRVTDAGRLRETHVVLVDDVVTTGATLNACAAALHASGIGSVSYVTFGRAPAPADRQGVRAPARTNPDKSI